MRKNKTVREYLRKAREKITPGLWGRYGFWESGKPPQPHQGSMEAAAGLTVGSTSHTEPIARFSGYGHNVEANADYATIAINYMHELLDDLDELEEENKLLKEQIIRMGAKQ